MKVGFAALDQLTLAEIELLFSESVAFASSISYAPLSVKAVGREYDILPGAQFYEVEDLIA